MPLYECTFIVRQDKSRADVTKLADSMIATIEQGGGKIVKNEYWGLKSLAYKVDKNRKGHYLMLGVDAPSAALKEAERQLRINEEVIRVLSVRVEELTAAPSVMMQTTRSRDEGLPEGEIVPDIIAVAAPAGE